MKKVLFFLVIATLILSGCGISLGGGTTAYTTPTPTPTHAPAPTPTYAPTPTVAPTATEVYTTPVSGGGTQQVGYCPPAADLGPWAPTGGQGETFEVTATNGPVSLQLWWPHGNTPWGNQEVHTLLDTGRSIEVLHGAGRGWHYVGGCDSAELKRQMDLDATNRSHDTRYHGVVSVDELINLGLVCDRRSSSACGPFPGSGTTTATQQQAQPVSAQVCGDARRIGDLESMGNTVTGPATVELHGPGVPSRAIDIVDPGITEHFPPGYGGAVWEYPGCNVNQILADVAGRPVVEIGKG